MKLKVAIIDDEIHAIETLEYDLKMGYSDQVEITFTSTDPIVGASRIRIETPDLLFLDVDMPALSGIDLLKLIEDLDIQVVVITAYHEFAIQAVGTKAVAYLLKPFQPEDLELILKRAIDQIQRTPSISLLNDRISVPDMDGIELIPHKEILYCKANGNYSTLVLTGNRKMTVSKTLKYFTDSLPPSQFIRIHKSFCVNLEHVRKYLKIGGGELVMANEDVLPISRNSRQEILKLIQNNI